MMHSNIPDYSIGNHFATKAAEREYRPYSFWPRNRVPEPVPEYRNRPLIVHTGPSGRVNTGGHTA